MRLPLLLLMLATAYGGEAQNPEAMSFAGKPLYSAVASPAALAKSDSTIVAIRSKTRLTDDDYVEIGKQLVATARYREAVEIYSEGLVKYPTSYKLLRNRGHRYITLRKLDKAITDLKSAEKLIQNEPDLMEYGLDGKPTATVRHQIWYHIGVYYYLTKDYVKSSKAFEKALDTAGDLKNLAGSSDWLYNCYQRLGRKDEAAELLKLFTMETDTDRENAYFRRIMLYKGHITPEQLVDVNMAPEKMSVQEITKLYGLANWYAYQGNKQKAQGYYLIILQSNAWPGFAFACAEKDLEK